MKKTTLYLLIVGFFFLSQSLVAQLHVDDNGSVGIGISTPQAGTKLHVTSSGLTGASQIMFKAEYTGSPINYHYYGIQSYSIPNPAYGVGGHFAGGYKGVSTYATAAGSGQRYGTYAVAGNGSVNYGIKAILSTGSFGYAGHFDGPLHCTGTFTQGSDEKLKEDIKELGKSIDKIVELKPKEYKFKQNTKLNLPKGNHFGLTAQDLELVFPELVEETINFVDSEGEEANAIDPETINYKSVN